MVCSGCGGFWRLVVVVAVCSGCGVLWWLWRFVVVVAICSGCGGFWWLVLEEYEGQWQMLLWRCSLLV